jgi:LPXTG-motif cell wall-anchored protein
MKFLLKHKLLMVGIFAFCLTLVLSGPMFAQTSADPNAGPNAGTTTTDTDRNDHNYSWIGLLGLAGLLGLLNRKRDVSVRHEETGMPRTAAR